MVFLSVLSFMASVLYLIVGVYAYKSNRKSDLCRVFFLLTCSLAIWSFAFGFMYITNDKYVYSFWNKISAFGWCTFEAIVLYFVLILVECKLIKRWYIKLLVMLPAYVFLYMVLFLFGPDIKTNEIVKNIFYIGNFIYNFSYLLFGIWLIFLWGHRSKNKLKKKQADIIVITSLVSFLLNFIIQDILPILHIFTFPYIGQLLSLIMLLGVNNAMKRYQFLSISSSLITDELFNELTGLTFLANSKGYIMKANKQVYKLLDYSEAEMIGSHITSLIQNKEFEEFMLESETLLYRKKFQAISVLHKSGTTIPFNLTIIPLYAKSKLLQGLLVIGEDIRLTKRLEDEIIGHKLTNEKLQSSERLFRKILEITPVAMILISKDKSLIKYQNSQAEQLFGMNEADWIGRDSSNFFINKEDQELIREGYRNNKNVSHEIQLMKKDGSRFIGMVTVIPTIYFEEEVALACVVDMTEQKHVEEMLKQKNDYILKLNNELIQMNNDLKNKSIRDGLTNLYNHQYMNEVLEQKLKAESVDKPKLCLMMLDIDHFKRVNDKFGHIFGDKVLATISELIRQNTRNDDFIGRYGGEEFIVILSDIELEAAIAIGENIRLSICNYDFGVEHLTVSISIGVTCYEGETSNELINKADKLLYQAKSNGRNRVESVIRK